MVGSLHHRDDPGAGMARGGVGLRRAGAIAVEGAEGAVLEGGGRGGQRHQGDEGEAREQRRPAPAVVAQPGAQPEQVGAEQPSERRPGGDRDPAEEEHAEGLADPAEGDGGGGEAGGRPAPRRRGEEGSHLDRDQPEERPRPGRAGATAERGDRAGCAEHHEQAGDERAPLLVHPQPDRPAGDPGAGEPPEHDGCGEGERRLGEAMTGEAVEPRRQCGPPGCDATARLRRRRHCLHDGPSLRLCDHPIPQVGTRGGSCSEYGASLSRDCDDCPAR